MFMPKKRNEMVEIKPWMPWYHCGELHTTTRLPVIWSFQKCSHLPPLKCVTPVLIIWPGSQYT